MQNLTINKNFYNPYYQVGLKIKDLKNSLVGLSNLYSVDLLKDFQVFYHKEIHSFMCNFDRKLFNRILCTQYKIDHSRELFRKSKQNTIFDPVSSIASNKAANIMNQYNNLVKFHYTIPKSKKNIDLFSQFISKFVTTLNKSLLKAKPFLRNLNISYDIIFKPIDYSVVVQFYFADLPLNMVYDQQVITVEQNDVIINVVYKNILSLPTTNKFYINLNLDQPIKNCIIAHLNCQSKIGFNYQDPTNIKTHIFNPYISTSGSHCFSEFESIIYNYANELNVLGMATTLFKWLTYLPVKDAAPNRHLYNIIPGRPNSIDDKLLDKTIGGRSSYHNCEIFISPDYEVCKNCTLNSQCHTYSSFTALDYALKEKQSYNAFLSLYLWNKNRRNVQINLITFQQDIKRLQKKGIKHNLLNNHADNKFANLNKYFVPDSVAKMEALIMENNLVNNDYNFNLNKNKWFIWKRKRFYHGEIVKFTWTSNVAVIGKLFLLKDSNNVDAYACQDLRPGDAPDDLFGYRYGWIFRKKDDKLICDMKTITKQKKTGE